MSRTSGSTVIIPRRAVNDDRVNLVARLREGDRRPPEVLMPDRSRVERGDIGSRGRPRHGYTGQLGRRRPLDRARRTLGRLASRGGRDVICLLVDGHRCRAVGVSGDRGREEAQAGRVHVLDDLADDLELFLPTEEGTRDAKVLDGESRELQADARREHIPCIGRSAQWETPE
jgi:hypothetical protein